MDVVATTDADGGHGSSGLAATQLFLPVNKRVPPVLITTRRVEELARSRLLVAIDHWPADSAYPQVRTMLCVVRVQ
jgi:exoribonuclease R